MGNIEEKRRCEGLFREGVLEIYYKNPFIGAPHTALLEKVANGTYELNFYDFKCLLRYWGTAKILKIGSQNGTTILEFIARHGSPSDMEILMSFVGDSLNYEDLEQASIWATENQNKSMMEILGNFKD